MLREETYRAEGGDTVKISRIVSGIAFGTVLSGASKDSTGKWEASTGRCITFYLQNKKMDIKENTHDT